MQLIRQRALSGTGTEEYSCLTHVDEGHLHEASFQSISVILPLLIAILLLCGPFPGEHRKKLFLCERELICPD